MKLMTSIEQYIRHHQALGKKYVTEARILRAFARRFNQSQRIDAITPEAVASFLGATGTTSYWYVKYRTLNRFYRRAIIRGDVQASPLPKAMPRLAPALTPYIYSCDEIRRLLAATGEYQLLPSKVEPVTVRTLILLLYGAGLRVGEARRLNREDVVLAESLITVRETKFYKSRLVPISSALTSAMEEYIGRTAARAFAAEPTRPFLATRTGMRLQGTVNGIFRRVCSRAGVHRSDGGRFQPRMHDLRHTFAVHRLTQWYREGADVQTLLPHLSVYLGHVRLASTQIYLSMTPELLQEASTRFESYAFPELSHV